MDFYLLTNLLRWPFFGLVTALMSLAMAQDPPSSDSTPGDDSTPGADNTLVSDIPVRDAVQDAVQEDPRHWRYSMPLPLPEGSGNAGSLVDCLLTTDVFSHARADLSDLRVFDSQGQSVPYALRYLRPEVTSEAVPVVEFNRAEPDSGPHEVTLDLKSSEIQHNRIELTSPGMQFRRAIEVDGSDDGRDWRRLVDGDLLRFESGSQKVEVNSVSYSPSRLRFVRVRVFPDPHPATRIANAAPGNDTRGPDDFRIEAVRVLRHVELSGERVSQMVTVGVREPTRTQGVPGSVWILDLQGRQVPCDQLEVDVADAEYARDVRLQAELPGGPLGQTVFAEVFMKDPTASAGMLTWQRRPGDVARPLVVQFQEQQTSRLKLLIADHRNLPLTIRSARISADARQLVFARPAAEAGELRLYFGNPDAEAPNYDFSRNLPLKLDPTPPRITLTTAQQNPDFVPPPQPLTERFPWLIYAVLGSVTLVLAAIIFNLAGKAIALHDARSF